MSDRKLKVYRMDDYDWWADYSEGEARRNYLEYTGVEEENISDMEQVTEEEMEKYKYQDEDMDVAISFKERLERNPIQGLFASTES